MADTQETDGLLSATPSPSLASNYSHLRTALAIFFMKLCIAIFLISLIATPSLKVQLTHESEDSDLAWVVLFTLAVYATLHFLVVFYNLCYYKTEIKNTNKSEDSSGFLNESLSHIKEYVYEHPGMAILWLAVIVVFIMILVHPQLSYIITYQSDRIYAWTFAKRMLLLFLLYQIFELVITSVYKESYFSLLHCKSLFLLLGFGFMHIFYDYRSDQNQNNRTGYKARQEIFFDLHNITSENIKSGDADDANSQFMTVQLGFFLSFLALSFLCGSWHMYRKYQHNKSPQQRKKLTWAHMCYDLLNLILFMAFAITIAAKVYEYHSNYDDMILSCSTCGNPAKLRYQNYPGSYNVNDCKKSCPTGSQGTNMVKVDFYEEFEGKKYCQDLDLLQCCNQVTNTFAVTQHCGVQDAVLDFIVAYVIIQSSALLAMIFYFDSELQEYIKLVSSGDSGFSKSAAVVFDSEGACMVPLVQENSNNIISDSIDSQ